MKTAYRKILGAMSVMALLMSCGGGAVDSHRGLPDDKDTTAVGPADVTRLAMMIEDYGQMDDRAKAEMILSLPSQLSMQMRLCNVADTVSDSAIEAYLSGRAMKMFFPEIKASFPADSTDALLKRPLTKLKRRLASEFPGVVMPHVYTVVSPFNQSVVLAGDTALYLALNHYLGSEHPAYNGFAGYIRRLKEPSRIVADVAEAIVATHRPYTEEGRATVLSRMVYEGVIVEAVMRLAGVDEATALGYNRDEMEWCDKNQRAAWDALLTRRMLFSTDADIARRLIAPGPATTILTPESPGRMGRFIGHRIVADYLENYPDAVLDTMLLPEFYQSNDVLLKSGYMN